jgi:hypothetical protein
MAYTRLMQRRLAGPTASHGERAAVAMHPDLEGGVQGEKEGGARVPFTRRMAVWCGCPSC